MGFRILQGICFHLLVLTVLLSTPGEARLFDAALVLTERAEAAAAADLDGDGIPDIVIFREWSDDGHVKVYSGLGDGTFEDPAIYSVGEVDYISWASLVIDDLDEDGAPDIAVMLYRVNTTRSDIWVLLNDGDGTFTIGDHYQIPFCASLMKVVELDGDGLSDLAVVHNDCGASGQQGWLSILYGRGDGTFEKAILHDLDFEVLSLAAGDFNGDGVEDLVLDEFQNDLITVLLGNGDGTFQNGVEYAVGDFPSGAACGDLNADGWPDLAVADRISDTVSVLMGLGDGSFQPAEHYPVAEQPMFIEISDIDNDQILDLVLTSQETNGEDVSILRGEGDGTFKELMLVETGDYTEFGVRVADCDGDGNLDLIAENGDGLSIILGNGDGTFASAPSTNAFPGHYKIDAGDVDADGVPDIVMPAADLPQVSEEIVTLLGRGDGSFGSKVGSDASKKFNNVAVEDLNDDGFSDAVTWPSYETTITVSLGQRDGRLQAFATIEVEYDPRSITIADLNGDDDHDLLVATSSDCFLLFGLGDGSVEPAVPLGLGSYRGPCDVGDLNHDGNTDLAVTNRYGDSVQVLLGYGDGTFGTPLNCSVSEPESVAIGDLDEDGHPDLAVSRGYAPMGILYGNGDGTFQEIADLHYPNVENPKAIEYICDLDLDGHLDMVVRCFHWIAVMLGNGDGSFRPFVYGIEESDLIYSVTMHDLDSDGDLDLAVSQGDRWKISILINNTMSRTISGDYTVSPLAGTLPFETNHQVYLRNMLHGTGAPHTRTASVAIDVEIGSGAYFSNWRAGHTNLSPNETLFRNWPVAFPASPTLAGANNFHFRVVDTTPAPYNHPPYPPSGDSVTRVRSVVAASTAHPSRF